MPSSKQQKEKVEARRADVLRMRAEGLPPGVIAQKLGISEELVRQDAHRVLTARRQELRRNADLLVADAVERTARIHAAAWELANQPHVKVSNSGRIVTDADGQPVYDPAPATAALSLALRAEERLAKLLALDGAVKIDLSTRTVTIQDIDMAIADLQREIREELAEQDLPADYLETRALEAPGDADGDQLPWDAS